MFVLQYFKCVPNFPIAINNWTITVKFMFAKEHLEHEVFWVHCYHNADVDPRLPLALFGSGSRRKKVFYIKNFKKCVLDVMAIS